MFSFKITPKKYYKVCFETSAFNYLSKNVSFEALQNTREFQKSKGREWLFSSVGIWEIFASQDENAEDFLIFSAQKIFDEKLLATPSEIVTRFLTKSYPKNQVNYCEFCKLPIADIWRKMVADGAIKFEYNKDDVLKKTNLIRNLSKNILPIIYYPKVDIQDPFFEALGKIIQTYYECLYNDGFFKDIEHEKYEEELLNKLVIFFVLILMILKLDMSSSVVDDFWEKHKFQDQDLQGKLIFFFESYPEIFRLGPFLQMAITAYYQIKHGGRSRGLIFDCYHALYLSYSDVLITADSGFQQLQQIQYFKKRLLHISDFKIFETPKKKRFFN